MAEQFFIWLSKDGPFEEIFLSFLLILLGIFIISILNVSNINIKGLHIEPKGKNKNESSKKHNSVAGSKISVTAYQDYIIINLIIQNHSNRVREEIRQYCIANGLDKKSKDEYFSYVEEKKGLYIRELTETINHEYMSYDIISLNELYVIISDLKDTIINKLDKLYIKIRDISITDHRKIEEEKFNIYNIILDRFTDWRNICYKTDEQCKKQLGEIVISYKKECEKLVIHERINILDKQIQRIDAVCKELSDLILNNVIAKINEKLKETNVS